jgi:hypothetical protein
MSNIDEDKEKKEPEPSPESIGWEELMRLEDAAEGGDTEAQKKLAELEGVKSYEEYKQLNQQVLVKFDQGGDSDIQSTLQSITDVYGPKLNLNQDEIAKLKIGTDAFISTINWDNMVKGLEEAGVLGVVNAELNKLTQIGNILREGILEEDDNLRRMIENAGTSILGKDYLENWLKDAGVVSQPTSAAIDYFSKVKEEINRSQMAELGSISTINKALSSSSSDAFLVSYFPSPEERLREEIAEQNRLLAENNRLQRELLDKAQQLPDANVTAMGERPKQKGRYRLTAEETKFRRQKVREAEKIKKLEPHKQWKEIDKEFADALNISERTFRAWRHNNY